MAQKKKRSVVKRMFCSNERVGGEAGDGGDKVPHVCFIHGYRHNIWQERECPRTGADQFQGFVAYQLTRSQLSDG